jgi:hypothetical protein
MEAKEKARNDVISKALPEIRKPVQEVRSVLLPLITIVLSRSHDNNTFLLD